MYLCKTMCYRSSIIKLYSRSAKRYKCSKIGHVHFIISFSYSDCIHITIIEIKDLHTKRLNLFKELDSIIHLSIVAKNWGLRKSRNAIRLNSIFKSFDTLKVKIIIMTFRCVIRTIYKKASMNWRPE